jgi:hypothetical protein
MRADYSQEAIAPMDKAETLHRLKFLYDQVHQTAERVDHLPASLPLHIHPQSINWDEDVVRIEREYNWLSRTALEGGTLTQRELEAEGLPVEFRPGTLQPD